MKKLSKYRKRYTIETVKNSFKKEGYNLLTENYLSNKQKLLAICPQGHHWHTSWEKWNLRGQRCSECRGNAKIGLSHIISQLETEGYFLNSSSYVSCMKKLSVTCPQGHHWVTSWNNFQQGYRCPQCAGITPVTLDNFKEELKKENYNYLKGFVSNKRSFITVVCPRNHEFRTCWDTYVNNGKRCPSCSEFRSKTIEDVRKTLPTGYKVTDGRINNGIKKFKIFCENGHPQWKSAYVASLGGCYKCQGSKAQNEIREELEKLGFSVISNDREVIKPYELDIYLSNYKLAIEHHGLYWHSNKFVAPEYHLDKYKLCQSKGIKLIQIFEDEWVRRQGSVLEYIKGRLIHHKKHYARRCTVSSINHRIAAKFLEKYHIQGFVPSSWHFGLFLNNELLQVVSLSNHHRNNKNEIVLARLATKCEVTVVGGASKLLNLALKEIGCNKIVTFADLRYSEGDSYKKIGFRKLYVTKPDYYYVINGRRHSKQSLQLTPEEKKTGKTERELRDEQGYLRIYDCGKIKYEYTI